MLDSAKRSNRQRGAQLSLLGGDEWYKQQASRCVAAGEKVPVQGMPAFAAYLLAVQVFRMLMWGPETQPLPSSKILIDGKHLVLHAPMLRCLRPA